MAVWSIIKKNNLEYSRLDPEYYKYKFLENDSFLTSIEVKTYQQLSKSLITKGETPLWRGDSYKSQGIPFLRSENLLPLGLNLDKVVYIDKNVNERMARSKVYPNDILLAIVGATIGVSGRATNEFSEYNTNQANAIIRPLNEKYSYYFAILNETKFIQLQMERFKGGGSRDNLDLHEVRKIKVPIPSKNILDFSYTSGKQIDILRKKSKLLYSQAEQILLEELRLKDLDLKDDLFCTTTLKEVKDNNRMDTEYYLPKYEKLMEHIFNFEHIPLGKLAKFKKGVEPGSDKYFKTGKPFLRVSNLSKFEIINNNQKYLENNLYMQLKKSYEPKKGEILLSKDATPGVAYVLKESIEGIISSGILRLEISSSIKKEYLALIINSQIGQMQMKRDSGGSVINHWKIEEIKNLKVPLLADNIQEKIENLCCESFSKRKQAKELLEEAKYKVEEMIKKEAGVK